jgi:hypothetical protein
MNATTVSTLAPRAQSTPLSDRLAPSALRVSRFAPLLVRAVAVASHSTPGQTHTVRLFDNGLVTCSCASWTFRNRCRYTSAIAAIQPAVRMCERCHQSPARQLGNYCSTTCEQAAADTLVTRATPMVEEPIWFSTCGCVHCGQRYAFSDTSPLYCPPCAAKRAVA